MATNEIHCNVAGGPSDRRFSRWYASDVENWFHGRYKRIAGGSGG
jgi:penicillin amidase